jgi:hypothetical protein
MSETKHATAAEPRDTAATLRADYEQMRSEAQGKPLTVAGRANLFGIADRAIAALAACERERDELREVYRDALDYKAERDAAEAALRAKGYRKSCDLPACNCGDSWAHGGHADERLREIADIAGENGKTLFDSVRSIRERADAAEREIGELRALLDERVPAAVREVDALVRSHLGTVVAERDDAIAALAACERERDEAREVVAKVNNSFGSYSYHTNPHPADEVEKVKRDYREQWQRANAANARADAALAQVAALRDSMEEMAIIFRNYYAQAIPRSRVEDMLEKYAALRRDTSHAADQLAARDARVRGEERERVAARLEAIAAMGEFNAAAALVDLQRELAKEPKT